MAIKLNNINKVGLFIMAALTLSSCDKWVNDTKLPDNTIDESQLNSIAMLGRIEKGAYVYGPVIAGVWRAGATSAADLLVASGAIVDEIVPTAVPNSLFIKSLMRISYPRTILHYSVCGPMCKTIVLARKMPLPMPSR